MHAYDVDGDGDNDIITAHAAHDFGLGWYEQIRDGERNHIPTSFDHGRPSSSRIVTELLFSEPHSVNLVDIDGDGLKDIVTGKTFWSHHRKSPMWDADPVVYWFQLNRADGVRWIPHLAGNTSGIGRQVSVDDINQDGLPDIVVGGMKGTNVLIQSRRAVDQPTWLANQPAEYPPTGKRTDRGEEPRLSGGRVTGAIEAEAMKVAQVSAGTAGVQDMNGFKSGSWSGGKQLFWTGSRAEGSNDVGTGCRRERRV